MDLDGLTELTYSWGLRVDTSNMAKGLALSKGIHQYLLLNVKEIIVFGYTRMIIQAIVSHKIPKHMKLQHLLKKIKDLLVSF